jgi:hypothetical protein
MHEYLVHPNRKRKHRCRLCCREFAREDQLRQHRGTAAHREAVRMLKAGPEEETTKCCSYCGLGLVCMAALKKHLGKLPSWYLHNCILNRVLNITQYTSMVL